MNEQNARGREKNAAGGRADLWKTCSGNNENMERKMQGWYNCFENLMRQRHDKDQSESQECSTVDSYFGLAGPHQYSIAPQRNI